MKIAARRFKGVHGNALCHGKISRFTNFQTHQGDYFECTPREGEKTILHRFVASGAVGGYHTIKRKEFGPMMTIDVALRRNEEQWLEVSPSEFEEKN